MSLAKWLDKVDGGPERSALVKLARLKTYKGDRVLVPLPHRDKDEYKHDVDNEEINEGINAAPILDVPLKHIVTNQRSVDPEHVAAYILKPDAVEKGQKNPKTGTPVDHVIVVKYKNVLHLHDGNHRVTAALLRGEDTIEARVVDLDSDDEVEDG